MRRLVDSASLVNPVVGVRVLVVPARFLFDKGHLVRGVAIHLVRAHEDERRVGSESPRRLEEVQGSHGIGLEVLKWDPGGKIVGRLCRAMDRSLRSEGPVQVENRVTLSDVKMAVREIQVEALQALEVPGRGTARSEETGALVVVDAQDPVAQSTEELDGLGPYQATTAGDDDPQCASFGLASARAAASGGGGASTRT